MPEAEPTPHPIFRIPARAGNEGSFNVVIETPRGSRHKYKFEESLGIFALGGVLPAGAVFPFDFGFIPSTCAEDGDPIDVLLLLDDSAFAGCLVPTRLIGVIEAEQREKNGDVVRNDRLIAVAEDSHNHGHVQDLEQVGESLLKEIEHFFISYNEIKGKRFMPLRRAGAKRAASLADEAAERYRGGGS